MAEIAVYFVILKHISYLFPKIIKKLRAILFNFFRFELYPLSSNSDPQTFSSPVYRTKIFDNSSFRRKLIVIEDASFCNHDRGITGYNNLLKYSVFLLRQ